MSDSNATLDRVLKLAEAVCDETASREDLIELDRLIVDRRSRVLYLDYCRMHATLTLELKARQATENMLRRVDSEPGNSELGDLGLSIETRSPDESEPFCVPRLLSNAYSGTIGYFSQELPLSMLIAVLIMASALWLAWTFNISHYSQLADRTPSAPEQRLTPDQVYVARITGMKDCLWSDPATGTIVGAAVSLDREYALSSGLMEITYQSGARVILEGPCKYKVDSNAGGYLTRGKLTARVEKKGSGFGVRGSKHSPLSSLPSPLFAVRTPTALVTDLGTEFGVEVAENGDTTSHVFQGSIKVQGLAASAASGATQKETTLHVNESIRVSRVHETHQDSANTDLVRFTHPTQTPKFVRRLYEPPTQLDLLDIVAGGNGLGHLRERGIDPASGREDTLFFMGSRGGDRQYRPVVWNAMIDGVFVPDGREGPVQVDSAGDAFDGFPHTAGETSYSIWARAADVARKHKEYADNRGMWIYHILKDERYMPEGRGMLAMHSNTGVTFDLESMRRTHGVAPSQFRAVTALPDRPPTPGGWIDVWKIDVWVLVDGKLKFKREGLRIEDGPVNVEFELGPSDRFLTLAVTDHDRDRRSDCAVFGDPVVELRER